MEIINQPIRQSLGFQLINALASEQYRSFRFVVAYAKASGVNQLLPHMQRFKAVGGQIEGIVGVDQHNTSYEALLALSDVCDRLYVYHSEGLDHTFHVKAYYFEGSSRKNWLAVGSNNFTAGGLFGNYEASILTADNDAMAQQFTALFQCYSDVSSPCCELANRPFIESLLASGYVQREAELANRRVAQAASQAEGAAGSVLFGRGPAVSAPSASSATPPPSPAPASSTPSSADYLIRHVPKAGGRSKQVHFTLSILKNYFHLSPGESLSLQQVNHAGTPGPVERRQVVLSPRNRNVKIEVDGAEILNDHYPSDLSKRPILAFRRIQPAMFKYVLLMHGDPGYDQLNDRLRGLVWRERSLPFEVTDTATMLKLWSGCPLL